MPKYLRNGEPMYCLLHESGFSKDYFLLLNLVTGDHR